MRRLVLDTNIVLDLFVFRDPAANALADAIQKREVAWLATAAMRDELASVLAYEQIAAYLAAADETAPRVLEQFDVHATVVTAPSPSLLKCRDADDQKFVDLAVAQRATLLSKDKDILALKRRLAKVDVPVARTLP